jgi:hypothetical protein
LHTTKKSYNCSYCKTWFSQKSILKNHMKRVHSDD